MRAASYPLLIGIILAALASVSSQKFFGELEENQLARSRFLWDAEGWNCSTKDGALWPVSGELQQLKSSDDDDTIWYYTASAEFLGNKVEAYGGTISFTLGHSEYNSLGLGAQEEYDIIIGSKIYNISLGHMHIVPPWVTSSENVVELSEDGGWVDTETGESASRLAILRTLSTLTDLKIRGSYYHGHEYSFIRDVILTKGVKQDLAWIRNDAHIDELCRALKLNAHACEHYGVHLMKALQKVNMNKLRAEYTALMRKRKENDAQEEERRLAIEKQLQDEQEAALL